MTPTRYTPQDTTYYGDDPYRIVTADERLLAMLDTITTKIAPANCTVLIRGERGTGKELVARAIHSYSPRSEGPFEPVNCLSLSPALLESELYGHRRGAFTSAIEDKQGLFEVADGGVLFLDEIGDYPPNAQAKLLRTVETKRGRRVGDTTERDYDVRLVFATNKDLEQLIEQGSLRADFYDRIKTVVIALPPLRERGRDVLTLAQYFLNMHSGNEPNLSIDAGVEEALMKYDWPGNVRELGNVVEASTVLDEWQLPSNKEGFSVHETLEVPAGILDMPYPDAKAAAIQALNRSYFPRSLRIAGGNIAEASRRSGLGRKTFNLKLRELGLDGGEQR